MRLPKSDEKLLEECDVDTFRSRGKGGQHVNKTESAVRIRHRPSGIVVSCQRERSQYRNKMLCLRNLREKFKELNKKTAKRIKTRIPSSVKQKLLDAKVRHGKKKKLRAQPPPGDE